MELVLPSFILTIRKHILNNYKPFRLSAIVAAGILIAACNQPSGDTEKEVAINLDDQDTKVAYAIGVSSGQSMAQNLASLDGTGINIEKDVLVKAFADGINDSSELDDEALKTVMNDFRERVNTAMQEKRKVEQVAQAKVADENKAKGAAYLEANKAKVGVTTLESGLQYTVVTAGAGKSPGPTDRVKVHYKGTLIDGTPFDSSYDRGQPATFGVSQVIKGWTEGLQLMKEGAKWQLSIPSELAYGPTSRPKIPGNSVLLFDVELLEVITPEQQGSK